MSPGDHVRKKIHIRMYLISMLALCWRMFEFSEHRAVRAND